VVISTRYQYTIMVWRYRFLSTKLHGVMPKYTVICLVNAVKSIQCH